MIMIPILELYLIPNIIVFQVFISSFDRLFLFQLHLIVVNIFGKLLKRPLHQIKDKDLLMVDIQKILLKKRYKNYEK